MGVKTTSTLFFLFIINCSLLTFCYAESDPEQKEQQKEERVEGRREEKKEEISAQYIIQLLKERAREKVREKKRKDLLKTRISASLLYGYETNVNQDSETKGDYYSEEDFSVNWQPTFNKYLGLDAGYWAVNQIYSELTDSSSFDHAINLTTHITPSKSAKIRFSPGVEYERLSYTTAMESNYENLKYFIKFRHLLTQEWNYGASYEYSEKVYTKKMARNQEKRPAPSTKREDTRQGIDFYISRYLGKTNFRVKVKYYVNTSNDQYLEYYDYDSVKPSLSIGRAFLKDDRLYVSFTPSFERKNYHHRTAVTTARFDNTTTWAASIYYTLKKPFTLSYRFSYKKNGTNVPTSRYKDITNSMGITADF